jgi:PKD repeat protein
MIVRQDRLALISTLVFLVLTTAALHAASVQLSWTAPTTNANGTALTDLAGYKVYYGTSSRQYTSPVTIGNQTSYTLSGLTSGQRYYISVTARDTSGNESTFSNEVNIVAPSEPTSGAPVASFQASPTVGSAPLQVTFTDTSTGSITSWSWTFGTGATSTTRNPTYTYQTPGTYTVSLTVTGSGGSNTVTRTGLITVHRAGLMAAYNFNEGSGTKVNDVSGKGNHGTISGAVWTTSGRYGKALQFDGSDDMVTVNDAASLDLTGGMTLEAWVYPTTTPSKWRIIIMKEQPGDAVYYLAANSSSNRPATGVYISGERILYGGSRLAANTWTHLAATYDGQTQRLYVNGSQVSQRAQTGQIRVSSSPLRIGGNSIWGEYFQGRIDEVRIYNRALSASEIQSDRSTALPTPITAAQLVSRGEGLFKGDEAEVGLAVGAALVLPQKRSDTDKDSLASDARLASAAAEPLLAQHLEIGEVEIDQTWKRIELRQPFTNPIVVAKALSYRESDPAVIRVRHISQTGFEISLQSQGTGHPRAPEAVGYLVIERGRFRLPDGTSLESGTVDADAAYPKHAIAFSQPFRLTPVVMTAVASDHDASTAVGQPTSVSKRGFQFLLRQPETSGIDVARVVSYIAWEPSTGKLDGLAFEVDRTAHLRGDQFATISFKGSFAAVPVFLAELQGSANGVPLNVRWDHKDLEGIDVKIEEVDSREGSGTTAQGLSVVGYILIR